MEFLIAVLWFDCGFVAWCSVLMFGGGTCSRTSAGCKGVMLRNGVAFGLWYRWGSFNWARHPCHFHHAQILALRLTIGRQLQCELTVSSWLASVFLLLIYFPNQCPPLKCGEGIRSEDLL